MLANHKAQHERGVGQGLRETSSLYSNTRCCFPRSDLPSEMAFGIVPSPHFPSPLLRNINLGECWRFLFLIFEIIIMLNIPGNQILANNSLCSSGIRLKERRLKIGTWLFVVTKLAFISCVAALESVLAQVGCGFQIKSFLPLHCEIRQFRNCYHHFISARFKSNSWMQSELGIFIFKNSGHSGVIFHRRFNGVSVHSPFATQGGPFSMYQLSTL